MRCPSAGGRREALPGLALQLLYVEGAIASTLQGIIDIRAMTAEATRGVDVIAGKGDRGAAARTRNSVDVAHVRPCVHEEEAFRVRYDSEAIPPSSTKPREVPHTFSPSDPRDRAIVAKRRPRLQEGAAPPCYFRSLAKVVGSPAELTRSSN